jgi:hypothetical protein
MPSADWPSAAADQIEQLVTTVRDRAVVPAQKATRAVVFGLLTSFFVLTALTVLVIGAFRGLVILTGEVWAAYLIVGGIFILLGALCWARRSSRAAEPTP